MRIINEKEAIHFAFERRAAHSYGVFINTIGYEVGYSSGSHSHDFPQLWYCRQGQYRHDVGENSYCCNPGSLVIVPPGVPHSVFFTESAAEILMLDISYSFILDVDPMMWKNTLLNLCMTAFAKELDFEPKFFFELGHDSLQKAEEIFSELAMIMYAPRETFNRQRVYEQIELLMSLPEFNYKQVDERKVYNLIHTRVLPVLRLVAYLNIHYGEKIDDERLLQEGGISRTGMYRYFPRVIGCTYSKYLQQLRVRWVLRSLRITSYSLSHIADICGFCDMRHMSQVFRKYYGVTPKNIRSIIGEKYCNIGTTPHRIKGNK